MKINKNPVPGPSLPTFDLEAELVAILERKDLIDIYSSSLKRHKVSYNELSWHERGENIFTESEALQRKKTEWSKTQVYQRL